MSSAIAHRLQGLLAAIERELDRSGVPGELLVTVYCRGSDVVRIGAREIEGVRWNPESGHLSSSLDDRVRLVVPGTEPPTPLQLGRAVKRSFTLVPEGDGEGGVPF